MKIAYVYDVIYPESIGGVEKRIHEFGCRLARMGEEIHLYGMKYWEGPDILVRDGMILHGVCPVMGLYSGGRRSILQALRYAIHLIPHLYRSDADIIDCQNFPYFPVFVCYFISRLKKQKMVITWHEFWGKYWFVYLGFFGCIGYGIERLALRCSTRVNAISTLTAEQMRKAGFLSGIAVIPCGMDFSEIQSAGRSDTSSDLIYVGRFIPEKHPELVVEAIHLLSDEYPDLRCLMIGDGPGLSLVRDVITSYGLSGRVKCLGFVENHATVVSLMKASKVCVLPSEREGFGIAALEGMACGLSLVTVLHPRNAAAAHVMDGRGYGARLDAGDIARGISQCLKTGPDLQMTEEYVKAHDWDVITGQILSFYQEVMKSDEKEETGKSD